MKHRTLTIVLVLVSALLLAGSADAAAKKPAKGKGKQAGRGDEARAKRFLSSPAVAKAFRLPRAVKLSPQQDKKRIQLIVSLGRDIRQASQAAKSAITADGKKFQLDRVKQMQQEGRQKMLALLTQQQRAQAARGGGNAKKPGKKRGKKKAKK
jgi:hypothetical protein